MTTALGNAVQAAYINLVVAFVNRISNDERSLLKGCRLKGITIDDGGIQITDDPARFKN